MIGYTVMEQIDYGGKHEPCLNHSSSSGVSAASAVVVKDLSTKSEKRSGGRNDFGSRSFAGEIVICAFG